MAKPNRGIVFIFVTLLLDFTGIGLIAPVIPTLIRDVGQADISQAAAIGGWLGFSYAITQFFCAPIIGALSDRFGRRPVLLAATAGLGFDNLFLAFAPTLGWLYVGRIIAGGMGGSFSAASAYIADVSPPEKRAQNFGLVGAAFGVGFILGPVIGGLVAEFGPRVPFLVAAGLSLLNTAYGYFVLPESLPVERRRAFNWRRANAFGALKQLAGYGKLKGLLAGVFLLYLASQVMPSTWSYFTIDRFAFTERQIGFSLGFVGLMAGLVQGLLVKPAGKLLGTRGAVVMGLCLYIVGLLALAMAAQEWQLYAFAVPYMLGGVAAPTLQGYISGQVSPTEQGELQGAMASLMSLSSIGGPLLMTGLFAHFTATDAPVHFAGAAFVAAAALLVLAIILVAGALPKDPPKVRAVKATPAPDEPQNALIEPTAPDAPAGALA